MKLKKSSSFLSIVLTLAVILGNFTSPVFAYEKSNANLGQVKTLSLSSTNGTILNKLNSISKSTNALSQDLSNKKQNLSEPKKKLGTDLLKLIDSNFLLPNQNRTQLISEMKGLKQFVAKADSVQNIDKRVVNKAHNELVYVYVSLNLTAQTSIIDSLVWKVTGRDEKNHLAVALVETNKLEALASLSGVRSISSVLPPVFNSGSVVTEGDVIHQTAAVRSTYSQGGAGIKIGVISDGVDHIALSQSSGDLPAGVTVLSNSIGGDEGTAMLEIIHDMAPDASLYFHDAGTSVADFDSAIDSLVAAGANVIVDDVSFFDQPYFQDGTIASHVASVLASHNIVYVSSAGNAIGGESFSGDNGHYQGNYYNDGYNFNDFSKGSQPTFKYLYVDIPNNGEVTSFLQWNDSFGSSGNNYNLYLFDYNTGVLLKSGTVIQNGTQDPLEKFSYTNTTGSTITAEIDVQNYNGSAEAKTLELFIQPSNGASLYTDNLTKADSIFGHAAVPGVIAVGAIDANDPGNDTIEPYSSQGPVTIIGQAPRAKPDITGIDCVKITGAGGFTSDPSGPPIFCGTSAAAPAIAAIVAQLWGQYPTATGTQIKNYILNSAVDLGTAGTDMIYGHGRADSFTSFQAGPTITSFNFTTPAVTGMINEINKTIAVTVPFGTNITALVPTIIKTGASVSPLSGVAKNFTTPQIYTVTASDGLVKSYTATVTVASNPAKAITSFTIPSQVGTTTINESTKTISVTMPYGTVVTALVPTITITGASVSPLSGVAQNFTSPVTYTVTAADGSTQNYVVTVNFALNSVKTITAFNFTTPVATGVINESAKTITVSVPYNTNVTALMPTITITGASVSPLSGVANNFTTPQTYTVTAADGSTKYYIVTVVSNPESSLKIYTSPTNPLTSNIQVSDISSTNDVVLNQFNIKATGSNIIVNKINLVLTGTGATPAEIASQIKIKVGDTLISVNDSVLGVNGTYEFTLDTPLVIPVDTTTTFSVDADINHLSGNFSQGDSLKIDYANVTAVDAYGTPVISVAGSANGNVQTFYSEGIFVSKVSATAIVNAGEPGITSDSGNFTITFNATAFGGDMWIDKTAPTTTGGVNESDINITGDGTAESIITSSNAIAGVEGFLIPEGMTKTFTITTHISPTISGLFKVKLTDILYALTDVNGNLHYTNLDSFETSSIYLNAVQVSSNKDIVSFVFPDLGSGVISGTNISVEVPFGTNVNALVPTITIAGASISPLTGVANNFTTPATYTVTAADTSTQIYTVTVTFDTNPDIAKVAADKAALADSLIQGANTDLSNITTLLTNPLPALGTINGSTITWASNTPSVVSSSGQTVIRPAFGNANATVILTATITKGAVTQTKTFTLTVLAETLNPDIAIAQVVTDQITALPTVADLTLPGTAVSNARIAYTALSSGQKALVTNLATLTAAEAQITALTSATIAVINLETAVGLDLTVEANLTDADLKLTTAYSTFASVIAGGAKTALANRFNNVSGTVAGASVAAEKVVLVDNSIKGANADLSHITTALTNPLPKGSHAGISWESSNTAIVSNDGQTINRPVYADSDATVILTASVSKGIPMIIICGGNGGNGGGGSGCGGGGVVGTTKVFTLIVLKLSASAVATITSETYTVNNEASTITNIPYGTSSSTFLAAITKGESSQTWNDSGINNPVVTGNTLVVTAQDGTTVVTYTVTVNATPITLSSIAITTPANKLSYIVGDTLDTTGLVVTGTYSDASTAVVTPVVVTGFNSSVPAVGQVLTVTFGGKTTTYTVDIVAPVSSSKAITAFSFATPVATGVINEGAHTIAVTVPYGTAVTALTPTIVITGASVSPTSGVAQNFTSPVIYTVTAADASPQNYTVTVIITAPSDLTALNAAIASAQSLYDGATEGTTPGEYAVGSKATLQSAITTASLITSSQNQSVVDAEVINLNAAIATFNAGRVGPSNLSGLTAAITSAQTLHGGAIEGTSPGEYPAGSKAILKSAIDAALLITSSQNQLVVNAAVVTLNNAVATFQAGVVGDSNVTALNAAIASAQTIDLAAVAGTAPGQYPAPAKTTLEAAIASAQTVNASANQSIVDAAVVTLNDAVTAFQATVIGPSDLSALSVAIASAQTLHDGAVEGTVPGNHVIGSKAIYQTAINNVSHLTVSDDQTDIDAAVVTLASSTTAFNASLVGASDLTALSATIASAQSLHDGATEGTAVGEYVVGSKVTLQTVIDAASLVTSSEAQSVVNTAVTTLNSAVAVFSTQIIVGISSESSEAPSTNSITVTWTTTHPATSRVVYDTVSHNPVTDPAPNYGYANSTVEDATLVTNHSVTVNSLSPSTTYFFRSVSHGSPETYGNEVSVATTATPPSGGGGGYTPPSDTTPPSNTSVSINAGAATTSSLSSTLTLAATDATQMIVSNDAGFAGASWESYATSKTWTLTSGDGVKTVYAKFRDAAGNMSVATSDTITVSGTGTVAVVTNEPTQGCSAGNLYNTLTGSLCVNNAGPQIPGCGNRTTGFSTATGQSCATNRVGQVLGVEHFNFTKLMKNGSKGNEVIELQKFLTALGYNLGTADGKFGAKTKAAVIKFQIANSLKGDGVVGPMVRAVLNK